MNYTSLIKQIQDYSNRTDEFFINQIPNFIDQGVSRIYSEARSLGFQERISGNLEINNNVITKPLQWKETVSLYIVGDDNITSYLLPRSFEFCDTYSPNTTTTGKPIFYADFSMPKLIEGLGEIIVSPVPDIAYNYVLTYLKFPLFDEQNPENFLTDRYPSLLLYACLFEAIPFLKDDERIAIFESLYNRALKDIMGDSTEKYTDRLSKRDKT